MKTLKVTLLASLLGLAGCIKTTTIPDQQKTYPFTFRVSGLDVGYEPMARSSSAVATRAEDSPPLYERFQTLEYFGHSYGNEVFRGKQVYDKTQPEQFGVVKEQLQIGLYYIGFFGIPASDGTYKVSMGSYTNNYTTNRDYLECNGVEIWYKEFRNLDVIQEFDDIEVEMTRLTGQLVLRATDEVPGNVSRVTIGFDYNTRYQLTNGANPVTSTSVYKEFEIPHMIPFLDEFIFDCLPTDDMLVTISIYGEFDVLLDTKQVRASVYSNKKTIITGEVFNNTNSRNLLISVSDDWGEDNVVNL